MRIATRPVRLSSPRRSKYRAQRTVLDGITFDSKAEAARYADLQILARIGAITELERQPVYVLHGVNLETGEACEIGRYRADFRFRSCGRVHIEDVKGFDTPFGRWKRRHAEAEYGIQVVLVR